MKGIDEQSYDEQYFAWLTQEIDSAYANADDLLPPIISFYLDKFNNDHDNANHALQLFRSMWE